MTDSIAHLWETQLRTQASLFRTSTRVNDRPVRRRSERLLTELFFDLLDVARPDVFIEAGAFDATTSIRAASMLPGATVVAFEANPTSHAHFSAITAFERHGVDYRNLALAAEAGPLTFNLESQGGTTIVGHGSTMKRNWADDVSWKPETPTTPTTVDGIRLDDGVPGTGSIAMWMDVEGAADKVLAGAPAALGRCDLMKIEVEEDQYWEGQRLAVDIIEILVGAGLVPVARDIESPRQFNIVFASPDLMRRAPAIAATERFLKLAQEREVPALLERARAHPLYGSVSRGVRRAARRVTT